MFIQSIADSYDSFFDTPIGSFLDATETRCAFDLLKPRHSESILDVGCGTGVFAFKLAQQDVRVTGIDVSDAMLTVARDNLQRFDTDVQSRVLFRDMDANTLTFNDDSFDAAVTVATMAFVNNPQSVFDEMMRVVKPGGRVLVGAINRESAWGDHYMTLAKSGDPVFSHASLVTLDQLKGFDPANLIAFKGSLFLPPDTPELDIGWETENRLSEAASPGFWCVLWRVPG